MKLYFYTHADFLREQFLEGVELDETYEEEVDISTLSLEERQFLLDQYESQRTVKQTEWGIPHRLEALLPAEPNTRRYFGARFVPGRDTPQSVVTAWKQTWETVLAERGQEQG